MTQSRYEAMPHGKPGFHLTVFSETKYESPLHHHDEYAVFYLAEGRMKFGVADDDYEISAGTVLFIEPGTPYYALYTDKHDSFHYYSIVFGIEILGAENDPCRLFLEDSRINRFLILGNDLLSIIKKMWDWQCEAQFGYEFQEKTALFNILLHVKNTEQYIRLSDLGQVQSGVASITVNYIIEYIDEHYKEHITLDEIMSRVLYSKSHIMRIFKSHTGMNIFDYINKVRIEKACLELIYSDKNNTEIALNTGFNTVQYFTKIFKRTMGCTPGVYRRLSHSYTNIYIPLSLDDE